MGRRGKGNEIESKFTGDTDDLKAKAGEARNIIQRFGDGIKAAAGVGAWSLAGLTAGVFTLQKAFQFATNTVNAFYDGFIRGAAAGERYQVVLEHLTGSQEMAAQMMEEISQMSQNLGIPFEQVAMGGQQMAMAAKDAEGNFDYEKWQRMVSVLNDLSAVRPDVPFQLMARGVTSAMQGDMSTLTRLLDVNVNQLLDLEETADSVVSKSGKLQGVASVAAGEAEAAAQGGIEAIEQLRDALGAKGLAEDMADTFEGTGAQALQEWESVKREFAEEVLPTLTEGLQELLTLYRDNEDEIKAFAKALGTDLAGAIAKVDWELVATSIVNTVDALTKFVDQAIKLTQATGAAIEQGGGGIGGNGTVGAAGIGQQAAGSATGGWTLMGAITGQPGQTLDVNLDAIALQMAQALADKVTEKFDEVMD